MLRLPLNQTMTHWVATPDGYGGYSFAAPVQRKCRWEEKSELVPGTEEVGRGIIFTEVDLSVEDYVILGTSASLVPDDDGAFRIRAFKKIPDLRSLEVLRKSWI